MHGCMSLVDGEIKMFIFISDSSCLLDERFWIFECCMKDIVRVSLCLMDVDAQMCG